MGLQVDNGIVVGAGTAVGRGWRLPVLEETPLADRPFADRVGLVVRERPWVPAIGLGVGLAGGLVLTRGAGRLVRGAATAALATLGAAGALAGAAALLPRSGPAAPDGGEVAPAAVHAPGERLRVITYNVHAGVGGPGAEVGTSEQELDAVAEAIRRERPDVVVLQEVERGSAKSSSKDVPAELVERLDPDGAVFTPRGTLATGRQEGTMVLTFNGVQVEDARGLIHPDPVGSGAWRRTKAAVEGAWHAARDVLGKPAAPRDTPLYFPRSTSDVMVRTPAGNAARVLSGHYNWPTDEVDYPKHQVGPLAAALQAWDGPTILGADFNVRSGSAHGAEERRVLAAGGLHDAFLDAGIQPGDPARNSYGRPLARGGDIDRVYVSDELVARRVYVAADPPTGGPPSDHNPVVVSDLEFR